MLYSPDKFSLTKQRLTIHVSNPYDHKRTTSFPLETPKQVCVLKIVHSYQFLQLFNQVKFESDPENINNEATQGSWIHHLHDRFSGSSNDKIRLFDNQSSKSNFSAKNKSTFQDVRIIYLVSFCFNQRYILMY